MGMMLILNNLWLILLQALAKVRIDKACEDKNITGYARCYLLLPGVIFIGLLVQIGLELIGLISTS